MFPCPKLLLPLVLLTLVVAGCHSEGSAGPRATGDSTEEATPIAGYEVTPVDLSRIVRASGTIEPLERVHLNSQLSAVLTELTVREGDFVEAGQLIAASDLSELRAELRRSRAQLAKLERQARRKRPMVERQVVSASELADIDSEIEIARSEIELWETRIQLSRVTAPRDGVVVARHVDPGGYVAVNEPIIDIADLSTLVVPVRLSERDVIHLAVGDSVEITVDAYPGEVLAAEIHRIFPAADPESRRVMVEIALPDGGDQLQLQPGFSARATFEVDRRADVLAVPDEALLGSTEDETVVYLVDDGHLRRHEVTTGVARRNLTEITDGLSPGDVVVGINPTGLREDEAVRVTQWVGGQ